MCGAVCITNYYNELCMPRTFDPFKKRNSLEFFSLFHRQDCPLMSEAPERILTSSSALLSALIEQGGPPHLTPPGYT